MKTEYDAGQETALNHALFGKLGLTAISVCSAPRAGKTTILEHTLPLLRNEFRIAVLESDLQPRLDAERIRKAGVPVWQIVTGIDRRPDARMVAEALRQFPIGGVEVLVIERVIDPDEPAVSDWGEDLRVVVCRPSPGGHAAAGMPKLPEGVDAVIINSMDCRPGEHYEDRLAAVIRSAKPELAVFRACACTEDELAPWIGWLRQKIRGFRRAEAGAASMARGAA